MWTFRSKYGIYVHQWTFSTVKVEYIALGSTTQKARLHQLLSDLGVNTKTPIEILEDKQNVIAMAKDPVGLSSFGA